MTGDWTGDDATRRLSHLLIRLISFGQHFGRLHTIIFLKPGT